MDTFLNRFSPLIKKSINGFDRIAIQEKLGTSTWSKNMSGKKLTSRFSRHISLLSATD